MTTQAIVWELFVALLTCKTLPKSKKKKKLCTHAYFFFSLSLFSPDARDAKPATMLSRGAYTTHASAEHFASSFYFSSVILHVHRRSSAGVYDRVTGELLRPAVLWSFVVCARRLFTIVLIRGGVKRVLTALAKEPALLRVLT